MKLVKLSLVAAVAASTFSVASATPLEEAIKDVDLSGVLRYRYESGNVDKKKGHGFGDARSSVGSKQDHKFKAQVNFKASIADNFKAFMQLEYNTTDGGYGADSVSDTRNTFGVRQLYLEYNNADYATTVVAGKQQLNTIWTDNGINGLVGTGVKVLNNSIEGLTLAAFAVDSFNAGAGEGDTILGSEHDYALGLNVNPFSQNMYGAALIGSYEALGGTINPQAWLAYINDSMFLYALDIAYNTTIFGDMNWGLEAAYLGNSVDNDLEKSPAKVGNGNFAALKGTLAAYGWDASLGGVYYGDKEELTFTTLEDNGNVGHLLAGEELRYTDGSNFSGDVGRNIFGYVTLGYTFNEVFRVGGDFVYGGTKTIDGSGGDKMELVARTEYKYSPKLSFSAWYSYVDVDADKNGEGEKNTVRLQALYKF